MSNQRRPQAQGAYFPSYPIDWDSCPPSVRGGLSNFIYHGIPTGGFLHDVLTNNLFGAMSKADDINKHILSEICTFIYNHLPSGSWGNEDKYEHWLKWGEHFDAK